MYSQPSAPPQPRPYYPSESSRINQPGGAPVSYASYAPPVQTYTTDLPSAYAWVQPPPPPPTANDNFIWYAITCPLQPHTYLLIVYFAFNVVFATIAFAAVVFLGALGVGLIPLCCLGLVILQILLYVVHVLAHVDARLYNCTAPAQDSIVVSFDVPREGLYHMSGHRISPDLTNFSKESLCAILYFVVVKFPLSLLTTALAYVPLSIAVGLVCYPLYMDDLLARQGVFAKFPATDIRLANQPIEQVPPSQVILVGVVLLYIAIGLLHLFASLLRWATKFFTCEFFATSGVVRLHSNVYGPNSNRTNPWPY
ncbi:hypothetical protein H310_12345 [Aphanomyces invadans]|uniref:Uncharacterized protein n=1 Tax=Aphanomyces invadans TaxID=157072 RepID=A0A024TJJ5_9STRA|nr:hypothetical protein H310_12345 [Aphanomyces invadans]ETV93781.1 hypothetical protein H310_12345 [Aphanomyces invadans]RHY27451.1 hypothetical protein DYB32_006762 [Aphanomyces invadans]|eukprot:XP_008877590.1 hypothetical protein H310_12345 [Aphanomyces invadans]